MTNRRSFLAGTAAFAASPLLGPLAGFDLALAQSADGEIRVGMTVATVPLTNGCPDQGGEGMRFMGVTLYDSLVSYDLLTGDKPAALRPCIATEWARSAENPKRWNFKLREGIKFHDGKVLDAEDVAFSFERAFDADSPAFDIKANGQITVQVPNIATWGVDGPLDFWVETNTIDGTLPYALTWLGITHRAAWEAAGSDWTAYLTQAVGSGPWKLESYNQRERAVLVRNPDYWDAARIPKSARLVLLPLADPNARVAALMSGQINFVEAPPPDMVPQLEAQGFTVTKNAYPHNWTWFLGMGEGSPWLDSRLRKAANLAVDREGLKVLLGGLMLEGYGLVTEGHPWYGTPTFKPAYDPDAARALVEEAGFSTDNPFRTKIAISSAGSGQMQPLAMNEYLQQNLREVGIEVEFEVFEWQALIEAWKGGIGSPQSRDCTALNISQSTADPFRPFARILRSDQIAPKGVNWARYMNADFDAMMNAALVEGDLAKQDALLARCHEHVVDNALFLFVAHDLNPRAMASDLKGFVQAQAWPQDLTPISVG